MDGAKHEYIKGPKQESYSSYLEWTLVAMGHGTITPMPPDDFQLSPTLRSCFDLLLRTLCCPHNVVGVVVNPSNVQSIRHTWKVCFKLGTPKCEKFLPLELWGSCAQHPINDGEVISFH